MPRLISGSTLRRGGSGDFIDLKGAMPQLPPTETTATGFTIATDNLLRTTYRSSLGFIEFTTASMYSSLPEGTIRILATGSSYLSVNTETGTLVVEGGIGVGANMHINDDIVVNDLTIGKGYVDLDYGSVNNIVIRGTALPTLNDFSNGQNSISIGYDSLTNLDSAYKSIAIGRFALSTGTGIRNSIAIGDSALKENGVIYSNFVLPIVNVTIQSKKSITNITNAKPAVATVSNHGLSTGDRISIYNVVGLTTGTLSLVNDQSFFVNVLTPNTFELYNSLPFNSTTQLDTNLYRGTAYTSGGDLVFPLEITVPNSDYTTGTAIQLSNLFNGLEELDNAYFYTFPLGGNVFQLYSDNILQEGVDGTSLTPWITGGTSTRVLLSSNNIAIGTNAGKSLYDGERNFFLGDYIAQNLTTGSYNFFIGHEVGNNLTRGSGNVSIMGDNLIDGQDNQVNIGGIFYYNGAGYLQLNSDTGLGLGTAATGTNSGALAVLGGISVSENIITYGPIDIRDTTQSTSISTGSLVTLGGVGVAKNLRVGQNIYGSILYATSGTLGLQNAVNNTINALGKLEIGSGGSLDFVSLNEINLDSFNGINLNSALTVDALSDFNYAVSILDVTQSTSTTTGALKVTGGVGIGGNLYVGGDIVANKLTIQLTTVTTTLVQTDDIIKTLNNTDAISTQSGALQIAGGVGIGKNAYIGGQLFAQNTTESTSTETGSLIVSGGIGVQGNLYIGGNIIPATDILQDLGSESNRWRHIYLSSNTIYLNSATLSINEPGQLLVNNNLITEVGTLTSLIVSGNTQITDLTSSTSTDSGALVVSGGLGISENLNLGGVLAGNAMGATSNTDATQVGFLGKPQVIVTSTYTLTSTDQGKHIWCNEPLVTINVPDPGTTYFPVGSTIDIVTSSLTNVTLQFDGSNIAFWPGLGQTSTGYVGSVGMATLLKVTVDTWYVTGVELSLV